MCIPVVLFRFRFYLAWSLAEAASAAAGVGYVKSTGKWNGITNNDLLCVEIPTNFRVAINNWNMGVARWINTYIYQRVGLSKSGKSGLLSTMASFFVSALWHGLSPGYYLFFLLGGIYIEVGKHLRRRLRSYFHYTEDRKAHPHAIFLSYFNGSSHPLAFFYDITGLFFTWVAMQYAGVAFEIMDVRRCLAIWSSWYFLPHLVSIGLLVFFNLFSQHRSASGEKKMQNGHALWSALRRSLPLYVGRRRRAVHRLLKPRHFIDPEANAKRMWDLLLTGLVLYTTLVVPYRVCFQVEASGGFSILENSMDVAFFIDIILNFITGLPLPSGEVSYNFRVIVRAYMRGWFAVDFCSTLPFESIAKLFGVGDNAHAALMSAKLLRGLKVLRLFKLARIRRLGKVFANLEDAVYTNQSLVSLAKLVLTMLFIAHLVACLWYAVGRVDPTESWLAVLANDPAGHVTDPNYLQYVRSVYWAIVTMTTIGYGDIVGHNNYERMLNIAVMAVGVSFFGYVIGTISTLVTNLDVAAARYEERMTVRYDHGNASVCNTEGRGKVQLVKTAKRGKEDTRLSSLGVGDHFGELEVYHYDHGNGVRICSAVAKSYCELTFLSSEAIQKISISWPEVIKHFRESAATSSSSMRRRVDPSVFDSDPKPPRSIVYHKHVDMPETVIKTALLNSKVVPNRPTRIIPYIPPSVIDTVHSRRHTIEEESNEPGDQQKNAINESAISPPVNPVLNDGSTVLSPSPVEREHGNQAWLASPEPSEPPSINAVHPLTRPYTSMAQGRKVTLESLPQTPFSKAKLGAKVTAFNRLDSIDPDETHSEELKHTHDEEETLSAVISNDHSVQEQSSNSSTTPERHYAPTTERATIVENKPSPTITPEDLQRHHEKTLALQQLAKQMAEQAGHPLDDSLPGGRAALAKAADENELHDMIVKIRDSPHEQPKRNFQSERVMLRGTYLFHPQEPAIVFWQFFVGIGIVYSIIVVPFRLGYNVDATGAWSVLEMSIDGFFFVDILLNFRTAYFDDERKLIYEPRALFWRYVKGWFFLDLISTVPIDELFQAVVGTSNQTLKLFPTKLLRLFRVARLLKLTRLIKLSRVFGRIRDTVQLSPSTERLFKLLAIMSIICHWNACMFHGVMVASETAGYHTWCDDAFFPGNPHQLECSSLVPIGDRYIAALYWAFTTLTTVGYGDIKPSVHSPYELVVVITLIDPECYHLWLHRLVEMKDYLRDSSVSERLCKNVKMLFDKMAPNLRFDVARLVAVETLFAIPLITVMEDAFKGFVSYALFLMKPVCIQRGESVCRCGSPGTETFFLVEGECDLLNSVTKMGRIIGENSVFEQYALMAKPEELYRTVSTATAITGKCILYSLTIHDFKTLEDVSPAVSTYFVSQLASVLVADDLLSLHPHQVANVQVVLRRGQHFRAVAEHNHARVKLRDLGKVAMANLHRRRSSEWSPDLLPKQLQMLAEKERACGVTVASANVNAIANRQSDQNTLDSAVETHSIRERSADSFPTPPTLDSSVGLNSTSLYSTNQPITEVSEHSERTDSRRTHDL
ncbi:hypothetical protein ON010_g10382 [Phytophthora cinnamomi]|nr:hypothetical protein ON010_g10382 [Phytophthora cinnamomi]